MATNLMTVMIDTPMWWRYYNLFYTKRGKLQVNISQQLGEYGSFLFKW